MATYLMQVKGHLDKLISAASQTREKSMWPSVVNTRTGWHPQDDHAFLEAGGILSESLAWLHGKTGDVNLLHTALRIARYSYGHRDPATALVPNEPDMGRWQMKLWTVSGKTRCSKGILAAMCTRLSMASGFCCWRSCLLRVVAQPRCTDSDSEIVNEVGCDGLQPGVGQIL